ncbi:branched-chain amino acid ABC transporter permease [Bacillus thermotolerans]|uniref:High-affinity branched-chain amino acid transport system permease protein LivH n=1 Tax=Bacillus thermotolerans TaxID=1221996 RepID=A0A0F5HLA6_BACTR|nr:branched-chain amino acid ABC transporter permease [Bacillus thermotolerans]KKB34071.1 High-affinity branched-chain amino acid transport system permease protein LivH [Bacillus thermotolerans]KKB41490.1 High-affinity branched-chain amino acid transport system permease protein LivH [Bacillus thermotolerans]KKB41526.1 High-affinity branched-chain amino acid transport system permease protein LivH [Bacillus thermotolerans]
MDILGAQLVNGLSYGLLLFIITCGLSLIFGILGVLNLAHGSLYMFGAYIAYSLTATYTQSFWTALIVAPIIVALIALVVERVLLRPTYHLGHLSQVLLTFGLAYVFHDIASFIWGSNVLSITVPTALAGSFAIFGQTFPVYRLAVIAIGLVIAILLWFVQEKTKWGAIIRAGLSDKEMIGGLGVNIKLVFTTVFVIGGLLAGFGGVIAAPVLGIYPSMEFETLILALVVLVIGGLGSISGTLVASILVGLVETFSRFLVPELSMFLVFGLMAVILVAKPNGLLGKQVAHS